MRPPRAPSGTAGWPATPEAGRGGRDPPLEPAESTACQTLMFDFRFPDCEGVSFRWYKPPSLWPCVTAAPSVSHLVYDPRFGTGMAPGVEGAWPGWVLAGSVWGG